MFLAPSHSDLGESLLITTLLGIPLGEPDGKIPIVGAHRGAPRQRSSEEFNGVGVLPSSSPRGIPRRVVMSRGSPRSERDGARNTRI